MRTEWKGSPVCFSMTSQLCKTNTMREHLSAYTKTKNNSLSVPFFFQHSPVLSFLCPKPRKTTSLLDSPVATRDGQSSIQKGSFLFLTNAEPNLKTKPPFLFASFIADKANFPYFLFIPFLYLISQQKAN